MNITHFCKGGLICYIKYFGCRFHQQDGTNYFCPSSLLIQGRWLQKQIKQMSGMEAANGQILSMKQHGFFRILGLRHMMTSSISLLWPWCVLKFVLMLFSVFPSLPMVLLNQDVDFCQTKHWMNLLICEVYVFPHIRAKNRGLQGQVFLGRLMSILPNLQKLWNLLQ